jgi:hypothetical protein
MFNSLAGTIFHGSKMPVIKYFHFFILHNALQSHLPLRDLSYALDVSHKTASLMMKRVKDMSYPFEFSRVDKTYSQSSTNSEEDGDAGNVVSFYSYCEIKSIVVNDALFKEFVRLLTQGGIDGIASNEPGV